MSCCIWCWSRFFQLALPQRIECKAKFTPDLKSQKIGGKLLLSAAVVFCSIFLRAAEPVVITEFMASNTNGLQDEDGDYSDWVEIFNGGTNTVNLSGWHLTDDANDLTKWTFPSIELPPNGFLVVFASGKDRRIPTAPLHANFSLNAGGEYLALVKPDGQTVASAYNYPQQYANISYGLGQNVTATWNLTTNATLYAYVPSNNTLGLSWTSNSFSTTGWLGGTNGAGYELSTSGWAVKVFRANTTVSSLSQAESVISSPSLQAAVYYENSSVINYFNSGGEGHYTPSQLVPGLGSTDTEDYVIEATGIVTIPSAGAWTFGVNSDDGFRLTVGTGTVVCDCLRGPGDTLGTINFASAGDYPIRLVFFERGGGSEVEVYARQGTYSAWDSSFQLVGNTAAGGLAVRSTPFGSAGFSSLIRTDLQSMIYNKNASVYLRLRFSVPNPAAVSTMSLLMRYDDGFVAYLNGVEVARANAPSSLSYDSAAVSDRPDAMAFNRQTFDLTPFRSYLVSNVNVLAIHGLNQSATNNNFLIVAEIAQFTNSFTGEHYLAVPSPGAFNSTNYADRVADTKFSHDRGFYETNFSLVITTATAGATIRYTLDGSVPSLTNGFTYTGPILITNTTTIRAAAFKTGLNPSDVDTQTYLFVNDIIRQPDGVAPGPGWPAPRPPGNGQTYDYGMDTNIVNDPVWGPQLSNALRSLPVFSVVMNLPDLFDPATGIYANPWNDTIAWERPASLELIYPDGRKGFHANCGIRIRGGYSRSGDNPKHAFRIFFRQEYGLPRLNFPLFGANGAQSFDKFDLRCAQNYSWSFGGDPNGNFLRDQFNRDTQLVMSGMGERGDFCHLFINGQYWGLYNTDERPEAAFGESYFGGNADDYDVIKVSPDNDYTIGATDGNMDAWTQFWQAATNGFANNADYQRLLGNNPDGTRNPNYPVQLDLVALIDYMLLIFYGGNLDAPISNFLGNTSPNNWYGLYNRTGASGGWRFIAHDSEHTLLNLYEDRLGPFPAGDPVTGGGLLKSSPQYIFQQLTANPEFRMAVADRVQKHFFNGGALTPESCLARFLARSNEIQLAVIAESARWGDAKREPPLTRNDWVNAVANVVNNFFPNRTAVVLSQLRSRGWFPNLNAPNFSQFGGVVAYGYNLSITHSNTTGAIYYTLDGSDPRKIGGAINPTAMAYSGPLTITVAKHVRARVFDGANWSALTEATFYVAQDFSSLALTEIMYHPPDDGFISGDEFEFLEFKNTGNNNLDLSGVGFATGVTFTFPNGTVLGPGQFYVLARNSAQFLARYPGVGLNGVYTGRLDNGGETLRLTNITGATVLSVTYSDKLPWPVTADGLGFSVVPRSLSGKLNSDDGTAWRGSTLPGGSPGADDPEPTIAPVLINEALTHTDPPQFDAIELFNPNSFPVNIGGWFLSDDAASPKKFRIPDETTIPAMGYLVFTEADFNPTPGVPPSFSLSSTGDEVFIFSGDASTNLTGYCHGFAFGAAANGVSFGRYVNSIGEESFPAQISPTLGSPNSGPRVGPVVINEIQYHPADGDEEFIELFNLSSSAVPLFDPNYPTNTWRLNGLGYSFPTNITIPPLGFLLLVPTNPAVFRAQYNVPTNVAILGPYPGRLQDSGERLELQRPDSPNTNGIPFITVDEVRYNDKLPWPVAADGSGPSLQRMRPDAYGNEPTNWFASGITPGISNAFNVPPTVTVTTPLNYSTFIPPANITLQAAASDVDGTIRKVEFFANGLKIGEALSAPFSVVWSNASSGTYSITARATDDDFAVTVSEPVTIIVFSPIPTTVISRGSSWKYYDKGFLPATNWTIVSYDDSSWSNGVAQLGYGDGDETTIVGYGPDSNNKYITTWFRKTFTVTQPSRFLSLYVNVLRDDGAVVYLNGVEIFRNNMPAGPIASNTLALTAVGGADETSVFYGTNVSPALLLPGSNVIAVEIHQANATSSDISFDLELTGTLGPVQPVVTLFNPQSNSVFVAPSTILLEADASSAEGSAITVVEFYNGTNKLGQDTVAPYSLAWINVQSGQYTLWALARNDGGLAQTSAPVSITVITNTPPVVSLLAPVDNAVFNLPASVLLKASATDPYGQIARVEFYADGLLLGEIVQPPYELSWTNPSVGMRLLTAVATDNQNARATSAVVTVFITDFTPQPVTLVSTGALWQYLDTGQDPGTNWMALDYNASSWSNGFAELGYGDASDGRPERTVISYGPNSSSKYMAYYFRHTFLVTNPADIQQLTLSVMRDDGAVAYLNGVEIYRDNMPAGTVTFQTAALSAATGADEYTFFSTNVNPSLLLQGTNILAVEVHQNSATSTDVSFDATLTAMVVNSDYDQDGLPNVWELAHGLDPRDPSDGNRDSDGDGMSDGQEFLAGTNPFDATSVLRLSIPATNRAVLQFNALAGKSYSLERRDHPIYGGWVLVTNIPPAPSNRLLNLPYISGNVARFYRIRVQPTP